MPPTSEQKDRAQIKPESRKNGKKELHSTLRFTNADKKIPEIIAA
jgi:hypothetical protein